VHCSTAHIVHGASDATVASTVGRSLSARRQAGHSKRRPASRGRRPAVWWLRFERTALTRLRHALLLTTFAIAAIALVTPPPAPFAPAEEVELLIARATPEAGALMGLKDGSFESAQAGPARWEAVLQQPVRIASWSSETAVAPGCANGSDKRDANHPDRCDAGAEPIGDIAVARR